jgi:lipopolysaccharide/colanic/teichoic acid biosynthesis glycosyltransferase
MLPQTFRREGYSAAPQGIRAVHSWRYKYLKRSADFVGALGLIIIFTIPGLIIALAIWLEDHGSVFYREIRIGRNKKPFRIWKFRSMRRNANKIKPEEIGLDGKDALQWRIQKSGNDPRITSIGRFLRPWSLDELPQLINILLGDMSFIGPRPIVRRELSLYEYFCDKYLDCYTSVVPGLSGLWQVSGRSSVDNRKRAQLDVKYVREWNLHSDLDIAIRTIPIVLGRIGAC